jgi:hypothetical protein
VLLGRHVAALDALGQQHLLLAVQQRNPPDRAQVQAQRVEARLDRQVELGPLQVLEAGAQPSRGLPVRVRLLAALLGALRRLLIAGGCERALPVDRVVLVAIGPRARLVGGVVCVEHLDPLFLEVAEQLLNLLGRELGLLQRGGDRLGGQKSPLMTAGDHAPDVLHVDHGCIRDDCQPLVLPPQLRPPRLDPQRRSGEPLRPPISA